jgi:excinuclease UvrABC nuclease subunit
MTLEAFKKKIKKIPDGPGVYFFLGKNKKVLYIGKATSLRDRTRSYFAKDLAEARGPLIVEMIEKAASLDWRATDSVLEALLLEASLIRAHHPRYNSIQKDDKSFNHVVITKEEYPRVLVVRGKELAAGTVPHAAHVFGPFPHGLQLQQAMKLIRKIFPYRTTCIPDSGKKCFDAQIGLCPGVCTGEVGKKEYRLIIRHIVLLFQGKKKQLLTELSRDIRAAAKEENFEEAKRLRGQIFALQHIQDVSLIKDEYRHPAARVHRAAGGRIEAYDIAHLRGSAAVGVMVVVEDGEVRKDQYRKFNIKTAQPGDDVGALREVLGRRLGHDEWPLPRLIVVDGAAGQMNAAEAVLTTYGVGVPVVGVVKDEKHRPREIRGARGSFVGREKEILLANAEAHRFAIKHHRRTRGQFFR